MKWEEREHGGEEWKGKMRIMVLDSASKEVQTSQEERRGRRERRAEGRGNKEVDRARGGAPQVGSGEDMTMVRLVLPSSSGFLLDRIW